MDKFPQRWLEDLTAGEKDLLNLGLVKLENSVVDLQRDAEKETAYRCVHRGRHSGQETKETSSPPSKLSKRVKEEEEEECDDDSLPDWARASTAAQQPMKRRRGTKGSVKP